jgi:pimeloyl-ACP methyl ester carboxylesterase
MDSFSGNGVRIAYIAEGEGEPVLLIHGFASNARTNWRDTGWMRLLSGHGFRAIALDNRGHGASDKFYDPESYTGAAMAEDALRLLDHLKIVKADVIGYSMGARLAAVLALAHPERVRSVVLGGLGANMIHGVGDPAPIAAALLADDVSNVTNGHASAFRVFADQTKSDRRGRAACIMATRDRVPAQQLGSVKAPVDLGTLKVPVLVAVGTEDAIAGPARPLADSIPGAAALDIPGRDHMKAVGDRVFKEGVLEFLKRRP